MKSLMNNLREKALKLTQPFCSTDYIACPKGVCPKCGSDDLMRNLPGVGLDWNLDFVIEHIVSESLKEFDADEAFEEVMRDLYPEKTTVGFMEMDTIEAMKIYDPLAWDIAKSEYLDSLESDEEILEIGNRYYLTEDLNRI